MNKIMQLYLDNKQRTKQPVNLVRNASEASLYIYDVIDAYWGVSALNVVDALAQIDDATVLNVYINSPGGDVFEGRAIMAAIQRFNGKTIAHIDSLCASAATSIALACNEVEMTDGAFFMIHNASGMVWGDKTAMRETADLLEKIEGSIVTDYTNKTGKDAAEVIALMDAETWFSAQEALDGGFIDRIAASSSSKTNQNKWNLAAFEKAPAALLAIPYESPAPNNQIINEPAPAGFFMAASNANRLALLQAL
ncbi:MAG: Clp protease ClpP [Methylotenera sp.]|nr:Clp protease ClpP [Methylotenera sp.]